MMIFIVGLMLSALGQAVASENVDSRGVQDQERVEERIFLEKKRMMEEEADIAKKIRKAQEQRGDNEDQQ